MATAAEATNEEEQKSSLFSILSSDNRDFLVSPSGNKVHIRDIEDNTIGLYFAANWFPLCENFTPMLTSMYRQLKDNNSKFEVVFVSSDEDQSSFDRFHSQMPWPAIPFNDLQSKRSLTERYQIEGIPSLIILDTDGRLIRSDGVELVYRYGYQAYPFTVERVAELEAEEKAKHDSQTLENLLLAEGRDYVISHDGQVPISSLIGKTIGLYFSADWCPPCVKFTARLASIYTSLRAKAKDFEIIFISLDRDEPSFTQCYSAMPWLALPHSISFSKSLSRYFSIDGIPSLVVIGPDGKTVTREGRNLINLHLEMAYPFTKERVRMLESMMDEEAKGFPDLVNHVGHRHALKRVSEENGGGPYICCVCEEQGLRWAYQCLGCGYEVHLNCAREGEEEGDGAGKGHVAAGDSFCAIGNAGV